MEVLGTKAELRAFRRDLTGRVGLVPTMGYLHDGHLALVRAARAKTDRVIATIFVNPTQFGPTEDLDTYPRDAERDLALLKAEGVSGVFLPSPSEMYHPDAQTHVDTSGLSRILIGALRPGHFRGVATVVSKLFNLVQPDLAVFGQKDYQQLCVIRTMVRDLDIPVEIEGVATMREADGLAMSSRNVRLSAPARAAAPALNAALLEADSLTAMGWSVARIRSWVRDTLADVPGGEVKSVDIRHADTLAAVRGVPDHPIVILLAVRFGDVLLIDNRVIEPKEPR